MWTQTHREHVTMEADKPRDTKNCQEISSSWERQTGPYPALRAKSSQHMEEGWDRNWVSLRPRLCSTKTERDAGCVWTSLRTLHLIKNSSLCLSFPQEQIQILLFDKTVSPGDREERDSGHGLC